MAGSPSLLTVVPPPPGQVSNFVNPPSLAPRITITNAICLPLSITAVALRMYTRHRLVGAVGADDYLLLIAMVCAICSSSTMQTEVKYGLGKHAWDVLLSDFSPSLLKLWMAGAIIYSGAMLFVKLSFLFLFRRIFTESKGFSLQWWFVLVLVIGYSVAGMLASLLTCIPIAMAWDVTITEGVCINKAVFYIINACLNVITDLAILALPMVPVWRTSFSRRQKIMVSILFGTGSFTCIVSMVRIKYIVDLLKFGDDDLTQVLVPTVILTIIEMHCAIICACAATLKPFIQRYFGSLIGNNQRGKSNKYVASTKYPGRLSISRKKISRSTWKSISFSQSRSDGDTNEDMEMGSWQNSAMNNMMCRPWDGGHGSSTVTDCKGPSSESQEVIFRPEDISLQTETNRSYVQVATVVEVSYGERPL